MPQIIQSRPFGEVEISDNQILTLPQGLLGFEDYTKFALLEENSETPFFWLQSLNDPELAFIVIQPSSFLDNYQPLIPASELEEIGLQQIEQAAILLIITVPNENLMEMTANLQGPIVLNPQTRTARQFISRDESHPIRQRVFVEES